MDGDGGIDDEAWDDDALSSSSSICIDAKRDSACSARRVAASAVGLVRCGLDLELGASRVRRPDFLLRRRGGREFVGEFLLSFAEMAERAGHRGLAFPCSRQVVARLAQHPAQLRVARSEGLHRRVLRVVLHVEARDAARPIGRGRLIDGFDVVVSSAGGQHGAALEPPGGGRAHGVVPVRRQPSDAIARVATPRTLTAGSDRRSGSVVSPGAIASARVCSDVFSKMKCPVPIWRVARVSN